MTPLHVWARASKRVPHCWRDTVVEQGRVLAEHFGVDAASRCLTICVLCFTVCCALLCSLLYCCVLQYMFTIRLGVGLCHCSTRMLVNTLCCCLECWLRTGYSLYCHIRTGRLFYTCRRGHTALTQWIQINQSGHYISQSIDLMQLRKLRTILSFKPRLCKRAGEKKRSVLKCWKAAGCDIVSGKMILQHCEYDENELEQACLALDKGREKQATECVMNLHLQLRAVQDADAVRGLISELTTERDESKLRIDALEDRVRQLEKHNESDRRDK